ncbi:MAG: hypothetical protein P1V18_04265 [Candidatus Gracilibacteria bacterium]|nr:hypothetical protein [Candidatus Gracilibacteria bacterium]
MKLNRFFMMTGQVQSKNPYAVLTKEDFLSVDPYDYFKDSVVEFSKPFVSVKQDSAIIIEDVEEENQMISEKLPVNELSSQVESIKREAVVIPSGNTKATEFIAPTSSIGESSIDIFAANISAGFGMSYSIQQLTIELKNGPSNLSFAESINQARSTFLNIFLDVVGQDGIRKRISTAESINSDGHIIFDRLDGLFSIPSGEKADIFIVADINSSSPGAAGYIFEISTDKNVLLDQNERIQPSSLLSN